MLKFGLESHVVWIVYLICEIPFKKSLNFRYCAVGAVVYLSGNKIPGPDPTYDNKNRNASPVTIVELYVESQ